MTQTGSGGTSACAAWGSGNKVGFVNSNGAIAECGGNVAGTAAAAPGCNNNWADIKKGGETCGSVGGSAYALTTQTFPVVASCLVGHRVKWRHLIYNATVPGGSVQFYGALKNTAATTPEAIIADATTTSSVHCSLSGPGGPQPKCPVDLAAWADAQATNGSSNFDSLDLRIELTPSAGGASAPTVNSWSVLYDCIPYE